MLDVRFAPSAPGREPRTGAGFGRPGLFIKDALRQSTGGGRYEGGRGGVGAAAFGVRFLCVDVFGVDLLAGVATDGCLTIVRDRAGDAVPEPPPLEAMLTLARELMPARGFGTILIFDRFSFGIDIAD